MIGVFDSGSGGLTVLKEIVKQNPHSDVIYFGDIKNIPYGSKRPKELYNLTKNAIDFLKEKGVTHIVSACNSVSKTILDSFVEDGNIIEMVYPTVSLVSDDPSRKIAVIATPATVAAHIYSDTAEMYGITITEITLENLAQAIEEGADLKEIQHMIESCIPHIKKHGIDTVILGCTQFPLVTYIFNSVFMENNLMIEIINPAVPVATKVTEEFPKNGNGTLFFYISKNSDFFRNTAEEFFKKDSYTITILT